MSLPIGMKESRSGRVATSPPISSARPPSRDPRVAGDGAQFRAAVGRYPLDGGDHRNDDKADDREKPDEIGVEHVVSTDY